MSAASATLTQETYLPVESDAELARVHDFIEAHEARNGERPTPRYLLAGPESGEQVELPAEVYRILHHVIDAMQAGLAVTVAPTSQTLTTQQAAELLGVSRPTVVKYLDNGEIAHTKVGSHRRVLLSDVLAFRASRKAKQYAAIAATSSDLYMEDGVEETMDSMREARRVIAERRRARR